MVLNVSDFTYPLSESCDKISGRHFLFRTHINTVKTYVQQTLAIYNPLYEVVNLECIVSSS